jgi:hypothetical protein
MEYTMLTLNPNLPNKLDLKRIEKEDSPSL